jgi:NADH:ubiquinone oxidoreductase subunit 3 (subunit A)
MTKLLLLSPPLVFLFFLTLTTISYFVILRFSAKGKDHPGKYLPYTSGQIFPETEVQLTYQAFFRIGLLFGILHVAALVISIMPLDWASHRVGLLYLLGISISAFVLAKPQPKP